MPIPIHRIPTSNTVKVQPKATKQVVSAELTPLEKRKQKLVAMIKSSQPPQKLQEKWRKENEKNGVPAYPYETLPGMSYCHVKVPDKLNDAVIEQAAVKIREGCTERITAACLCVSDKTWCQWKVQAKLEIEQGIKPEASIFIRFLYAIAKADADYKSHLVNVVTQAAQPKPGMWQAGTWALERRAPDEFGKTEHVDISGNVQVSEKIEITATLLSESIGILMETGAVSRDELEAKRLAEHCSDGGDIIIEQVQSSGVDK
jgi:hypothetical protein